MTIMRMRSAILTIAYYISAIFPGMEISVKFGKLLAIAPIARPPLRRHLGTRPETHIHIHTSLIRLGLELKALLELT